MKPSEEPCDTKHNQTSFIDKLEPKVVVKVPEQPVTAAPAEPTFKATTIDSMDGGNKSAKLAHLQSVFRKSTIELKVQQPKKKGSIFQS